MPPRKAKGSIPPSGNPKIPVPPIQFDEHEQGANRKMTSSKPAKRRSFSDFLTFVFIRFLGIYFIIGALFTCSSHPFRFDYSTKDSNSICRSLAHGKNHIIPVLSPVIHAAHQRIHPYTGPYFDAVKPYTQAVWTKTKPYYKQAEKQSTTVYNNHVEPRRKKVIKRARSYSDPHIKKFNKQYQQQVQPHVDNVNKAIKPYQDIYDRDVAPYLSQSYSYSLAAGGTLYSVYVNQIHPRIVKSLQQLHSFYIYHVDPAMRRSYSLYIRPQVEKLLARIFERKAHATGSEAIAEAKREVKQAGKEGNTRSKEAQEVAQQEAIRRKNDPSIVEKAKDATEAFLGVADEANVDEIARLDAELDAEAEKTKEQLEAWESGMSRLMAQEYKLFTERISELRNRRLADLPDHFASLTETYVEDEVAAVLARLERVYKKLGKSDLSISEKVKSANEQYDAQKAKLSQSEKQLQSQVTLYSETLAQDEIKSLEASVAEIRRYVVEAGRSYEGIMDEAKFEQTVDDYNGWDRGMMKRANMIEEDMRNLLAGGKVQSGMDAVDLRKEPKLDSHIDDLQSRVKKLYTTANLQVDSYVTRGNLQLRGEGALGAISDATDAVAEQAKFLSEGAAALMFDSAMAARKKIGLGPKEAPGILERVQQGVHQATQSVASAVGATPTTKNAGDYIESATSLAASAVGYQTEPDRYVDIIGEKAGSMYNVAASSASDLSKSASKVYDSAASYVEDGFTAATTSAGNVASYIEDGFTAATTSAGNAVNNIEDGFTAATTSAGNVASNIEDGFTAATTSAGNSIASSLPTSVPGGEAAQSIVNVAQEQYASISASASNFAASAGVSGSSLLDDVAGGVVETANKGVKQGSQSIQDLYESVKDNGESAREAIVQGSVSAKDAATDAITGENSKLVGKKPEDQDYNTVGKAAEAVKDKIVHAEL